MVALQIRDVPEDVRDALAARARARGQSLQTFLLAMVQDEARRSRNLALLVRFADRTDGSTLTAEEATAAVEHARSERTRAGGGA
jgi:plasmid stability protein